MAENHYDLDYTGSMVDRILDTGYDLQNQGYIFRGLASHYTGTPTERIWLIAPTGSTGFGLSSPVPPGSIGICMYNGSSWSAEVLNTLTLDSAPTTGSGNGITSGAVKTLAESITNAIGQLEQSVSDRFTSMELEDTTGSLQAELLSITLKYVFEGEEETLTSLSILAATAEKAGLMSAADKQKLDAFVTNIRSLRIQDTTAQADQGTEITNTLKWTIGGVTEAITAFTLYAATTSKAGLMSAADKTALDTLPSLINAGYLYAGIATPSTVPSSTSAKIYYIAIDGGTYTNFGNLNVTQGINIIYKSGDAWSVAQVVGIDNEPTAGSDNLVKSGGVKTELALGAVYDVSAHNNGATFESLSALLSDTDLNALIPTAVRKGGMSIKFVQSSDNKYIQARCMAQNFTMNVADWQGVDDEPTAGSDNLVKSGGVKDAITGIEQYFRKTEYSAIVPTSGDINYNDAIFPYKVNSDEKYEIKCLSTGGSGSAKLYIRNTSTGTDVLSKSFDVNEVYTVSDKQGDELHIYKPNGTPGAQVKFEILNISKNVNGKIDELNTEILKTENDIKKINNPIDKLITFSKDNITSLSINTFFEVSLKKGIPYIINIRCKTSCVPFDAYLYVKYDGASEFVNVGSSYSNIEMVFTPIDNVQSIAFYSTNFPQGGTLEVTVIGNTKYEISKNKFNANWHHGTVKNGSAEDLTTGYSAVTDKIKVNARNIYAVSFTAINPVYLYFHYFATDGSLIESTSAYNVEGERRDDKAIVIQTPTNTHYLRIQCYRENVDWQNLILKDVQIEANQIGTALSEHYIPTQRALGEDVPTFDLPSWYTNYYMQSKVTAVKNALSNCKGEKDIFVFITDQHTDTAQVNFKSPELIKYIMDRLPIRLILCGGDVCNTESGIKVYSKRMNELLPNYADIHYCIGNHEYLTTELTPNLMYDYLDFEKNDQIGNPFRHYYYFDNVQQKIRYIVLARYDESEAAKGTGTGRSATDGNEPEQLNWLENVALDIPTNYVAIILNHNIYDINMSTRQLFKEEIDQDLLDVINTSNARNDRGKVIFCMQGHSHVDRLITSTYTESVPILMTTCDKCLPYIVGNDQDLDTDRTPGTISEQAFDVVVVDKVLRKVTAVRIGAPALDNIDNTLTDNQVGQRVFNY